MLMIRWYCCFFSSVGTRPSSSVSAKSRMSASGVLSSWLTFATKSLLSRDSFSSRRTFVHTRTSPASSIRSMKPMRAVLVMASRRTSCSIERSRLRSCSRTPS